MAPLDRFKYDIKVRVLLIPLSLGSNGLSIIEATHVFLVEPLINEAIESQAIARVARIGQIHNTFVHKYVLKGTIEEKIVLAQTSGELVEDSSHIPTSSTPKKSPSKAKATESTAASLENIKKLFEY